jgi:predicted transposase/invertase (TIGR01784 family)
MERFLNPRNDWMFKQVFGKERNKDVLIGFLNAVFDGVHEPIEDVEILPSHQDPDIVILRQSIVDVKCTDTKNRKFIVEMQCYNDPDFDKRSCAYASRAYVDQLVISKPRGQSDDAASDRKDKNKRRRDRYHELKPIVFLAVLYDFIWLKNGDKYVHHNKILDITTHENNIKEFSYTFIELDKFCKTFEQSTSPLDKWCYFFKNAQTTGSEELEMIKKSCPLVSKAYDVLECCNYTQEEYEAYWLFEMGKAAHTASIKGAREEGEAEGEAKGRAEGEAKGKAEGIAEGKRETAIAMLADGLPVEKVSSYTGLSVEEVNALRQS